jgi:hypothetical protein
MARQSEQFEREAEETRARLAGTLDELRLRLTPGQVVDQLADYVRDGPAADFFRNLAREIRENPIPVLLIMTGVGWLVIASARSPRIVFTRDDGATVVPVETGLPTAAPAECWSEERTEELIPSGA